MEEADIKEIALVVISALATPDCEGLPERLDTIYRFAHVASDSMCEHEDWKKELLQVYKKFKQNGLI